MEKSIVSGILASLVPGGTIAICVVIGILIIVAGVLLYLAIRKKGDEEPASELQPQPKPVAAPAPAPQPKPQPAPAPAPQQKPQPAPVAAQQPKPQPKPVAAQQPKPQLKPVAAQQQKPQPKPVAAQQQKPQPKPVAAQQQKPQPKPVAAQQQKPQPKPVAAQQQKPQPKPQPKEPPKPVVAPVVKPKPKKEDIHIETRQSVKAAEVDKILEDEIAATMVEESARIADKTKTGIINIDILEQYFKDGETVTLEEIKKRIQGYKKVTYIKVLARGTLDKKLTVEADDYSIEAVKMILLTGGKVIRTRSK